MCGLFGVIGSKPIKERKWFEAASRKIAHRGPDGEGVWWDVTGRLGFGHRRLAILDLSPSGSQPMHIDKDNFTVVFNGEIYNHLSLRGELEKLGYKFRSTSDTEVLLTAYREWGDAALNKLDGMFAFVLYDRTRDRVLLARDRAGEKPLFLYTTASGELLFSSELKVILCHPEVSRSINAEALHAFLGFGYVPQSDCMLDGARKLPAGAAISYNLKNGSVYQWRYWTISDLPVPHNTQHQDLETLASRLEPILSNAVESQLNADVPVGILLSGGVDSSLITALACRHKKNVKTYTVRFPGGGIYDESIFAAKVAQHFGTDHTEIPAERVEPDLLDLIVKHIDEPMIDSSSLPTYIVSRIIRQHCSVAIGGDGADELFGGYRHYSRILWAAERFGFLPYALRRTVAQLANGIMPTGMKGRNHLSGLATDYERGVPLIAKVFTDREIEMLLGCKIGVMSLLDKYEALTVPVGNLLERATRTDFRLFLSEDILVKVDRMSMAASLETRAPFLDRKVIEFAFTEVPSALKATSSERKIVLRALAKRLLPENFDSSRKQGFSVPLALWLRPGEKLRSRFEEVLLDADCMFEVKTVRKLFSGLDRGRNNAERLFGLVLFELWRNHYRIPAL